MNSRHNIKRRSHIYEIKQTQKAPRSIELVTVPFDDILKCKPFIMVEVLLNEIILPFFWLFIIQVSLYYGTLKSTLESNLS